MFGKQTGSGKLLRNVFHPLSFPAAQSAFHVQMRLIHTLYFQLVEAEVVCGSTCEVAFSSCIRDTASLLQRQTARLLAKEFGVGFAKFLWCRATV